MNSTRYNAVSSAVRDRVLQIKNESPWMEDYEIEAIVCTEFNLDALNVSEIRQLASIRADGAAAPRTTGGSQYAEIKTDAIGKFGAYEPVNKGAAQRRDVGTRALYDLTGKGDSRSEAVLNHARSTIKANISRESSHVGFSLLLFVVIEAIISVIMVAFTVGIMGWNLDQVYEFITEPKSMALLHAGMLLIGLAFPFLAYLFIHKLPINEMIPLHKLRKGELMPMFWIGLAMMMIDGCFVNNVTHPGGIRGANYSFDVVSFGNTPTDALLTFFCLGVVPALIESFVFNGVILQVLRRRGGDTFALLASSLLFAILTTNFAEMPGAFLTSILLGYMVIFSGSLIPAVAVKLAERVLFFAVTQLGFGMKNIEMIGYLDSAISVIIVIVGLLSMGTLLKRFPEFFVLKRSDPCLSLSQKMRVSMTRWPIILLIAYSLVFSFVQVFDLEQLITYAENIFA